MWCSMFMQIYAVYWLRPASSAFSLARTCNWLATIMVMRCVMRNARTPKFQLSGPTVRSLYCVFGKCSPCSTLYSTTELCWVGRIIGSQPKPWVVLSAGNFWEGNDSLRTSSLMNALRSGVFKLKSIFYFPWRNLIATETTEPGARCLVFIRQSRTKYNLLKERLRQHHEEARATRPIVISQLHTGYSLSKRTLVF